MYLKCPKNQLILHFFLKCDNRERKKIQFLLTVKKDLKLETEKKLKITVKFSIEISWS